MLDAQLELLVITYNRAAALERTLAQLHASPFAGCRVAVLDNCSTDDTPAVCARWAARWGGRLRVVRHRRNVGLCANYLRAVELAEAPFAWVLCDDDTFDFSDCADVIAAVESDRFDLVCLGSAGPHPFHPGETTTPADLVRAGSAYFLICSFVPSLIFRTARFDSASVAAGYRNAAHLFPHFDFLRRSVESRFPLYLARHRVLRRDQEVNDFSNLRYAVGWAHSTRTLHPAALRRHVLRELLGRPFSPGYPRKLLLWVLADKVRRQEGAAGEFARLGAALTPAYWPGWLLAAPLAAVPAGFYRWLNARRRRRTGQAERAPEGAFDPLRL